MVAASRIVSDIVCLSSSHLLITLCPMRSNVEWYMLGGGLIGFAILVILGIFFILPFWLLWNWLMPLFGLPTLTLLQSMGLYLLIRIILFQYNYTDTNKRIQ